METRVIHQQYQQQQQYQQFQLSHMSAKSAISTILAISVMSNISALSAIDKPGWDCGDFRLWVWLVKNEHQKSAVKWPCEKQQWLSAAAIRALKNWRAWRGMWRNVATANHQKRCCHLNVRNPQREGERAAKKYEGIWSGNSARQKGRRSDRYHCVLVLLPVI